MRLTLAAGALGIAGAVTLAGHPQQATTPVVPVQITQTTGVPCVRVNQEADGHCSGYGVVPYQPGDPRLGTPANTTPVYILPTIQPGQVI